MKSTQILFGALSASLFLSAGCKTATSPSSAGRELFNGRDFSGWTFCMKGGADPRQTWSVRDGVIHCTGRPPGYLRTTERFANYRLTVVWRFVRVAPHADNSGVLIHIQPPDVVFPECVECQGQFQHQGDILLCGGASAAGHPATGKTLVLPQNGPPNENPVGDWNTDEIVCRGGTVQLFVNGKKMNEIDGGNLTSGYIGIQSEGGEIEVRQVRLQPLR